MEVFFHIKIKNESNKISYNTLQYSYVLLILRTSIAEVFLNIKYYNSTCYDKNEY